MEIITFLFFGIIFIYSLFIGAFAYGFKNVKLFKPVSLESKTHFSIIVPFRNEEKNLPQLMYSFSQLNYPRDKFEILFVNDSSKDNSIAIIKKFPVSSFSFTIIENVRISNSPKKDAIETAVKFVSNKWIITTDADCYVNQDWLKVLDVYIQKNNPEMIAGAVSYSSGQTFLHHFQQLDLMSLQGATIGSFGIKKPFMCNGANFAYTKKLFLDINGFEGNNEIASGDDVFLLQKTILDTRYGTQKVHYLKTDANVVLTNPAESWKDLLNQRIRWASKATSYQSNFAKVTALIVFAGNLTIVLSLFLTLFSFFSFWNWYLLFAIKISIDFLILYQTGKFIKPQSIKFFLISNLFYPFFSVYVAFSSFFVNYQWKDRKFK